MPDPPAAAVDYAAEAKEDGATSQSEARSIKIEWDPSDVKFWFSQLEGEMVMATIKSAWLKRTVLQRNLPIKQRSDVKAYLTLTKAEGGATIYKDIKDHDLNRNLKLKKDLIEQLKGLLKLEKIKEIVRNKQITEKLISRILPRDVFKQLSEGASVEPKPYENVTIYFSDIVGFTSLASEMNPLEVMMTLVLGY